MRVRRSLRAHILMWLGGYALLLTAAVMLHGFLVNEIAERLVWDSLLKTELEHHLQRRADDPRYRWSDTDDLQLYASTDVRPLPPEVVSLAEGIHDELMLGDREDVVIDGLTGRQRLFMSWAQAWRTKGRDEMVIQRLATDPHSPPEFRCNQIVRNVDAFYEAFDVKPGDKLWLDPELRVKIW